MKKWLEKRRWLYFCIKSIPAVEKILILAMLFLFIQFILVLTTGEIKGTEAIDVVTRSMAAIIFGYFIGDTEKKNDEQKNTEAISQIKLPQENANGPVAKIGFTSETSEVRQNSSGDDKLAPIHYKVPQKRMRQIWIVGGISIISLILLLMVRNVEALHANLDSDSGLATLTQLRDFVAGGIGFLISASKNLQ